MARDKTSSRKNTLESFFQKSSKKRISFAALCLTLIFIFVSILVIVFSTDKEIEQLKTTLHNNARVLVETKNLPTYKKLHKDTINKLVSKYNLKNLEVTKKIDKKIFNYNNGSVPVTISSPFDIVFYVQHDWAGENFYLKCAIYPSFPGAAICFALFLIFIAFFIVSFLHHNKKILREFRHVVLEPLTQLCNNDTNIKSDIEELLNIQNSILRYKKLISTKNKLYIALKYHHELKEPAYFLYTKLQLLNKKISDKDIGLGISGILLEADKKIENINNRIREFTAIEKDWDFVEKDIVKLFVPTEEAKEEIKVLCNPYLLNTVTDNLRSNALKACFDINKIKVTIKNNNDFVVIETTNPILINENVKSSGIGLELCKDIIKAHSGTLSAKKNTLDNTYTVKIKLPIVKKN